MESKNKESFHKETNTRNDTVMVTKDTLQDWNSPPFQRPLKVNARVLALAESIKADGGVIPGIIALGELKGKTYIIDGQHRLEAFKISGIEEGYCDIRIHKFDSIEKMGEEFVQLNSRLVNMKPDDILRGLEGMIPALQMIRGSPRVRL